MNRVKLFFFAMLILAGPAFHASAADGPAWSLVVYIAGDNVPGVSDDAVVRSMLNAHVPPGVELLVRRDLPGREGVMQAVRRYKGSNELAMLPGDRSGGSELLKWAGSKARGKYKVLWVISRSNDIKGFTKAVSVSGLEPDVVWMDDGSRADVNTVQTLKDAGAYLIIPQFGAADNGFPAGRVLELLGDYRMTPKEFARALPGAYVKEYSPGGTFSYRSRGNFTPSLTSIDTAKWAEFYRRFVAFESKVKACFDPASSGGDIDVVEFLERLPGRTNDPEAIKMSIEMLDPIGYPREVSKESSAAVSVYPSKAKFFELRIVIVSALSAEDPVEELKREWMRINSDLRLPEGIKFEVVDLGPKDPSRKEFIVRGNVEDMVSFRPWLGNSAYSTLTTYDAQGYKCVRRYPRENFYFSADRFPETSFLVAEAHGQGEPLAHGVSMSPTK